MVSIMTTQLASWIAYLFIITVRAQSGCNHDDCYNALFPCDSILGLAEAVDYCSTVGHYGATNYPTRATAACGNTNKQAYMSACACGVACPSFSSAMTLTSSVVSTIPTTLTTSTTATGGIAQSSPESPTLVPSTGSTSAPTSLTSNSTASSISSTDSSISLTVSMSTTASTSTGTATDTQTRSSVSSSQVTDSGSGSSLAPSSASSISVSTAVSITTTPGGAGPAPSNASSTLSLTSPGVSAGSSSVSPSRLTSASTSTGPASATISSSQISRSSVYWMNSTCISEVVSTSSASQSATSSTLSDSASTAAPSSGFTSSSVGLVTANSTATSSEFLSTSSVRSSDLTSVGPITVSAIHPSDTTCIETEMPSSSLFYHFPNSTIDNAAPLPTGALLSTGTPLPSSLTLNHTSTSTVGAGGPSCTASSATNSAVENGDFETGLSPWSVDLVDIMSTSYSVTGPGANGSCGAFRVAMRRNLQTDDLRANLRLVSPLIAPPQPSGSKWLVSFWVRFGSGNGSGGGRNAGNIGGGSYVNLYANGAVAHRIDATSVKSQGNWTHVEFPYATPRNERMLQLVFSFALGEADVNEVWIDRVAMDVVAETSSTAVGPMAAVETSRAVEV